MIIIKSADILQTKENIATIRQAPPFTPFFYTDACTTKEELETEIINGHKFRRPNGEEIVIGMSKELQDLIGIQYEAYFQMQREIDRLNEELSKLKFTTDARIEKIEEKSIERFTWFS